ncbi:choice-of-anchor D domain-containing protein [bacterium]|nr:choice-of-anchor D domain-containing protein [bacterium]
MSNIVGVAVRDNYSLALRSNGTVLSWGSGTAPPAGLSNVTAIAARGSGNNLALKSDGRVVSWGSGTAPPAGLSNVTAIAAGNSHSLALQSDGTVVGWGSTSAATPPAGLSNVVAIAAGGGHSLALQIDGTVVGWGSDSSGQATVPAGLSNVVAIAAGGSHSLALQSDGSIIGWGDNFYTQATAPDLRRTVAVSAGYEHDLALKSDGTVVSWVWFYYSLWWGAVPPAGLSNVVAVSAGFTHSLALKGDGTVAWWNYPWAPPGEGQPPADLSNVVAIAGGNTFDLALKSDGTVVQWGDTNAVSPPPGLSGIVAINVGGVHGLALKGDGTVVGWGPTWTNAPPGLSDVVAVAAGWAHNLALKRDGTVVGWGSDVCGQATAPSGLSNVVAVSAGLMHSLALKSDGTVVGWGANSYGQATPPAGLSNVVAISAGWGAHSIAVQSDGTVVVWGGDSYVGSPMPPRGLTGTVFAAGNVALQRDGTLVQWPSYNEYWGDGSLPPEAQSNVTMVAIGDYHKLALKEDGTVIGWLTSMTSTDVGQATPPDSLSNVVGIAVGDFYSLALKSDGTVVGWGTNSHGQATPPAGLSNVMAIAAGSYHSLALKDDGTVVGWGTNTSSYGAATPPGGLSGVVAIAAGGNQSLALRGDGTVVNWGTNGCVQANPPAGLTDVVAISAGSSYALALKGDGNVVTWGCTYDGFATVPDGLSNVVDVSVVGFRPGLALTMAPDAPSGATAVRVSTGQINVYWHDNSPGEERFGIERALAPGGAWAEIGSAGSNVTVYADTTVAPDTTYYYRVRAYNSEAGSMYSARVSASTAEEIAPVLVVAPGSHEFGSLLAGQTSTGVFAVVNTGAAILFGTAQSQLPFVVVGGSPYTIGPGATGVVSIAFAPTADGVVTGSVVFASNGGSATTVVSGDGVIPLVAAFTATPTNGVAPLTVTFADSSTGTITNRSWSFGDGTVTNTSETTVQHVYSAGTHSVTLTVEGPRGTSTNAQPDAIVVENPPQLVVNPASRGYGTVAVGQSPELAFQVANTGGQTLNGSATLLAGGTPFTVTGGGSFSVPAGQTSAVSVAFAPSAAGAFTNQVVFASNGGASTNEVTGTGAASSDPDETLLVAADGLWKYLDNGSDQGTAWRDAGFDDTSWAAGAAPLGYGDPWIVTTNSYGPDPDNKYITTYYRCAFTVTDPAAFATLRLRLNRDDGAVVYINGTEVRRDLMATGTVTATTLATGTVSGSDESAFFETTVSPAVLVTGTNVIAVEVHQTSVTSSDISFDLELAGAPVGLRKGPYLVYSNTNTQMQVLWQTDGTPAQQAYIEWGPTPAYGNNSGPLAESGAGSDQHQFSCIVTGLTPGVLHHYRVVVDSGSCTGSFVAAPPVDATNVTFYGFGDTRTYPDRMNAVTGAMGRDMTGNPGQRNTLALQVGDWVEYGGTETSWQNEFFNRGYTNSLDVMARTAMMGCRGNHDLDGGSTLMPKYWPYNGTNGYFSFDYGPVHVTVIDQYVGYTSGTAQYSWLTNDLATTTKRFKVAVFHVPAYSAGGGHANDPTAQAVFDPVFTQYGVQIALVGHNHYYAHCLKDGVHHITSGGGGAPLHTPDLGSPYLVAAESAYQFVRFDVSNTVMTVTAVRTNDTVIESFLVYQIPAAQFAASPTNGPAPLVVTFTDVSTGAITNRHWDFGDGLSTNILTTSIDHLYAAPGMYSVQLVASGPSGSSTNIQAAPIVVSSVDTVGDGIPDWWRILYYGGDGQTTNAASCAGCDPDGDGRDNQHEYTADTDPTNRVSYLAIISIQPVANDVQITWVGGSNAWQYLASAPDITAPAAAWTIFHTNAPPTPLTNVLTHTGAATATNLFYRINAQRPE